MFVKYFSTSKRGEGRHAIEDSISINLQSGRFAVSDGVSRSFLPKVWSNILTQAWVSADNVEDFPSDKLFEQFRQERDRIFKLLDEDTRMDYDDLERKYKTASATFCGVEVHHGKLKWVIIGDSCLFLLPEQEHPLCISSHPMPTNNKGRIIPYFDNTPFQVLANGNVYGEWNRGERSFEKGVFLLMSDAMSEWFINAHNNENKPLEQLLVLTDDESFEQWVDEQYNLGLLRSDDESVIIVQLDEPIQEEEILIKTNTVPSEENALLTVESPDVSEEINSVADDDYSEQLIDNTSNLGLLKSNDEVMSLIHVDELIQEEEILIKTNTVPSEENALLTVESPDVSEEINSVADDDYSEQLIDNASNLGLLKSNDEVMSFVHVDEPIQEEEILIKTNTVPSEENSLLTVESPNVSERLIKNKKAFEENIAEQSINQKKKTIRKKMNWLKFITFFRLLKIKYIN